MNAQARIAELDEALNMAAYENERLSLERDALKEEVASLKHRISKLQQLIERQSLQIAPSIAALNLARPISEIERQLPRLLAPLVWMR